MARTEARIFTSIWKDPHFLSLDVNAQRLYFFLISQDDLTYSGIMPLRPRRWAGKASGLTVADIEKGLEALQASPRRFVIVDEDAEELLVRSLLRRDGIWKQPNLLKLARESVITSDSPQLPPVLLTELRRLPLDETPSAQVKTLVADFIQDLEQGYPYPPRNPPDEPADEDSAARTDDPTGKDYACAGGTGEGNASSTGDSPIPLFPDSPTSLPPQDRKRGTRLPEGWLPTRQLVDWARKDCPHVDSKRETERFKDYWIAKPGKDGRKLDWNRTWQNWMRTAEDRQGPRDRPGRNRSSPHQGFQNPESEAAFEGSL
jgi:hypothetical protein